MKYRNVRAKTVQRYLRRHPYAYRLPWSVLDHVRGLHVRRGNFYGKTKNGKLRTIWIPEEYLRQSRVSN